MDEKTLEEILSFLGKVMKARTKQKDVFSSTGSRLDTEKIRHSAYLDILKLQEFRKSLIGMPEGVYLDALVKYELDERGYGNVWDVLKKPLEDVLKREKAIYDALKKSGIKTMRQLVLKTEDELCATPGISRDQMYKVLWTLASYNLRVGMTLSDVTPKKYVKSSQSDMSVRDAVSQDLEKIFGPEYPEVAEKLKEKGISSAVDLVFLTKKELLNRGGIGRKTVYIIETCLEVYGLRLGMLPDNLGLPDRHRKLSW